MLLRLAALCLVLLTAAPAEAADKPSNITGVYLTTRYPALTVRAGETTTIDLSLRNEPPHFVPAPRPSAVASAPLEMKRAPKQKRALDQEDPYAR